MVKAFSRRHYALLGSCVPNHRVDRRFSGIRRRGDGGSWNRENSVLHLFGHLPGHLDHGCWPPRHPRVKATAENRISSASRTALVRPSVIGAERSAPITPT